MAGTMPGHPPQPRRRDAAVLVLGLLVLGSLWFTVLGPMGGPAGWRTLLAIALVLGLLRLAGPGIRAFSRRVRRGARR